MPRRFDSEGLVVTCLSVLVCVMGWWLCSESLPSKCLNIPGEILFMNRNIPGQKMVNFRPVF